ncbi:MAG TPA: putative peptidoglycan glycosyltransferase FtsW [Patescibacteria group bacterium]|jgi:cell division protein FtsW|nr:putative peptidoglycan glycosyltransferase FtsW [Patescibacteria group bacterium]
MNEIVRKHRPDFLILLFMAVLMLVGMVVIYSISPALTERINTFGNTLDQNHFMYRQAVYLIVGLMAFAFTAIMPLGLWRKYQSQLLVAALLVSLVPTLAQSSKLVLCTNGACRWINFGAFTIQPAEALKFAMVIFLAGFLATRVSTDRLNKVNETLVPVGIILAVVAMIVVGLQKDLGTGLAFFGIMVCMLYVAGLKIRYFVLALIGLLIAGALFTITSVHRLERVSTFVHGANDKEGTGYQINQALIAIGSGGITGKGLGQGVQAFGYLPEAANDSIFAVVAESLGFIGIVLILIIFAMLFLRLLRVMDYAGSDYHRILMAGIFGWIFTHTVVNIGAMLGVFPLTGVTLPFLSFGGTSLLFIMAALGLAFQISRYTMHKLPDNQSKKEKPHEDRRGRRRISGSRYAGTSRFERT